MGQERQNPEGHEAESDQRDFQKVPEPSFGKEPVDEKTRGREEDKQVGEADQPEENSVLDDTVAGRYPSVEGADEIGEQGKGDHVAEFACEVAQDVSAEHGVGLVEEEEHGNARADAGNRKTIIHGAKPEISRYREKEYAEDDDALEGDRQGNG